jgi:hypothetical protein
MLPFIDLNYAQIWDSTTCFMKYLICIFFISVAKLIKYKYVCAHLIQNEYIFLANSFFFFFQSQNSSYVQNLNANPIQASCSKVQK